MSRASKLAGERLAENALTQQPGPKGPGQFSVTVPGGPAGEPVNVPTQVADSMFLSAIAEALQQISIVLTAQWRGISYEEHEEEMRASAVTLQDDLEALRRQANGLEEPEDPALD